jgi:hypothetical protein
MSISHHCVLVICSFLHVLYIIQRAGCGYGDFMLWTGNAISPLDPMLYEHNMNFPNNTSYDEERLQDVSTASRHAHLTADIAYHLSLFTNYLC